MNYEDFVRSRAKWLGDPKLDLLHAAIGAAGEAGELFSAKNRADLLEELGDCEFYLQHARMAMTRADIVPAGIVGQEPLRWTSSSAFAGYAIRACDFLDLAKKVWVYNKPLGELPFDLAFKRLRDALDVLEDTLGFSSSEVQQANQRKLEKRYPTGYSDAAAQARADKAPGE